MFQELNDQAVWVQVVLGLIVFLVGLKFLGWLLASFMDLDSDSDWESRRLKREADDAKTKRDREKAFVASNPTIQEEAFYLWLSGSRSIDQIRAEHSSDLIESILQSGRGAEILEEVTKRRATSSDGSQ